MIEMYWVFWESRRRAARPLNSARPSRPSTWRRTRRFAAVARRRSFVMGLAPPIARDRRRDGAWTDDRSQVGNRARRRASVPPGYRGTGRSVLKDLSADD